MTPLNPFLKRRLWRIGGAMAGLLLFIVLQQWQSTGSLSVPFLADRETLAPSPETEIFFPATSTLGVSARVVRVVDGDTVEVELETTNEEHKVRLLGVNTPESVDPRRSVQCFGKEASHRMKALVEGKRVFLLDDPKADDRDKYGRLLRTIVRADDFLDINATLVNQGYANTYLSFPLDVRRKAQLRLLEQQAKQAERGLWSPATCAGKK